jgi:hypothetical protein
MLNTEKSLKYCEVKENPSFFINIMFEHIDEELDYPEATENFKKLVLNKILNEKSIEAAVRCYGIDFVQINFYLDSKDFDIASLQKRTASLNNQLIVIPKGRKVYSQRIKKIVLSNELK